MGTDGNLIQASIVIGPAIFKLLLLGTSTYAVEPFTESELGPFPGEAVTNSCPLR